MNYSNAIEFIYGLQKFGLKLGLERITKIAHLLGNPQEHFHSIHIAGTNGKGSVSAMISFILIEAGFKTGLYTSPHLVSFTERIRIDNKAITEQEIITLTIKLKTLLQEALIDSTTFFEFVTALCFDYFKTNKVNCAVIETGLGGRLDATNILRPKVSVITKIGIDHAEYLGNTITKIASEKAGIIKEKIPVIVSKQEFPVIKILREKAQKENAPIYIYEDDFTAILRESTIKGIRLDFKGPINLDNVYVPLCGRHQLENSSTAIMAAFEYLRDKFEKDKIAHFISSGLSKVTWEGRLQFISYNPPLLIDGAHNPQASQTLSEFIKNHLLEKSPDREVFFLIAIMSDKDIKGILSPLLPQSTWTVFTKVGYNRSAQPEELSSVASSLGFNNHETAVNVSEALSKICLKAGYCISDYKKAMVNIQDSVLKVNEPVLIVTGSFYLIGEVLELLGKEAILRDLREDFSISEANKK
ncbi:MAG TPA: bifunctional folylpolyglutamate synthase/dihydrofolate synthase [Nitrospirae bacterium]|nr:bifunctional folylpolyglutamate synthase/dihydrofolate synthase [Nitrospirota bacterium]